MLPCKLVLQETLSTSDSQIRTIEATIRRIESEKSETQAAQLESLENKLRATKSLNSKRVIDLQERLFSLNENLEKFKQEYGEENLKPEMHAKIRSSIACLKSTKKIISLAKKTNGRLHVFHLSTKEEANKALTEIYIDKRFSKDPETEIGSYLKRKMRKGKR